MKITKSLLVVLAMVVTVITGCNKPSDEMVGEYSTKPDGKAEFRVTKNDAGYAIEMVRSDPAKNETVRLVDASEKDSANLIGAERWKQGGERALVGANNNPIYIAKVKPGAEIGPGVHVQSGYFLFLGPFPAELHKL